MVQLFELTVTQSFTVRQSEIEKLLDTVLVFIAPNIDEHAQAERNRIVSDLVNKGQVTIVEGKYKTIVKLRPAIVAQPKS